MNLKDDRNLVALRFPDEEGESRLRPGVLSAQRLRKWQLVLESRSIPYQAQRAVRGFRLFVPAEFQAAAQREIVLFEKENRHWPPVSGRLSLADNILPTLSILGLLAVFHNLVHVGPDWFGLPAVDWLERGNAHAGRILGGEWWRTVTSLTLHGDGLHLLSNIVIGGFFAVMLCRLLGGGLGWSMTLLAGIVGNLGNAWMQAADHRAVGSSTALFGVVGLLASFALVNRPVLLRRRWSLPVAGALALLALLGAHGERVDIGAHLWGFGAGLFLGFAPGWWVKKHGRPSILVNSLLAMATAALVFLAWRAALTA